MPGQSEKIADFWSLLSLAQQFVTVGSIVLVCGMAVIGAWVADEIEVAVTQNTASATALYMDSFVAPAVQDLAQTDRLSSEGRTELDRLFKGTELGKRITSIKIWKEGGLIAYSTHKSLIGKNFPVTNTLKRSWQGAVTAEFDALDDDENALDRQSDIPFVEIYSPIREKYTGRIIAVAEFYENAHSLKLDLFRAQVGSWIIVLLVTFSMIAVLSTIVLKGSHTIESQKRALEERVDQLSILRDRLQSSSRLATELNERFLRRIGSELHDGPAQLISLAMLRLPTIADADISKTTNDQKEWNDHVVVLDALKDALKEIRDISDGLVLPEYENRSLKTGIERIVSIHEQRTGMTVHLDIDDLPVDFEKSIKICLYRLIQEGLNNAFHHAQVTQVDIRGYQDGKTLRVDISDNGVGFDTFETNTGLGLPGMRERIESIGGEFSIRSSPTQGTTISANFVV